MGPRGGRADEPLAGGSGFVFCSSSGSDIHLFLCQLLQRPAPVQSEFAAEPFQAIDGHVLEETFGRVHALAKTPADNVLELLQRDAAHKQFLEDKPHQFLGWNGWERQFLAKQVGGMDAQDPAKILELAGRVAGRQVVIEGFNVPDSRMRKAALAGDLVLGEAHALACFTEADVRRRIRLHTIGAQGDRLLLEAV